MSARTVLGPPLGSALELIARYSVVCRGGRRREPETVFRADDAASRRAGAAAAGRGGGGDVRPGRPGAGFSGDGNEPQHPYYGGTGTCRWRHPVGPGAPSRRGPQNGSRVGPRTAGGARFAGGTRKPRGPDVAIALDGEVNTGVGRRVDPPGPSGRLGSGGTDVALPGLHAPGQPQSARGRPAPRP